MKITDVQAIYLSLPTIAKRSDGTQDALIVKVTTDAGITGVGEVDSSPLAAKAAIEAPMSSSITSGLRELVIGENPFEYERLWHEMYHGSRYAGRSGLFIHAMSGIDLALWDIMGKAQGLPVHTLLGGAFRKRVRAYASTLFGEDLASTADKARRCVDEGFTAVKFGWDPMGRDPDYDEALVDTIRNAVGPRVDVLIDAGQCWDTKSAIQMARRFEPYDIYWLEEPLRPDNIAGYAELSRATHLRIAAGEAESDRHSYLQLMEAGNVDVVQVDVTRTGGLTEAKKIAWAAYDRGRSVINHSFTTDVNIAASLALLASIPEAPFLEFCVEESPIRNQLVRNPFVVEDGYVSVPDAPGLGVELDDAVLESYARSA
ncbi:MAG: mandelate racemase/muconate lactonizing enzyme family protein [Trueperaceae bacterium]